MTDLVQLDDNLVNGRTYTFQFNCTNWLSNPSAATVQQDIVAGAPDFLTSLAVTSPFTTSLYNVQFTYEGDNSDVVSDVANSIIAAIKAGSNDGMTFVGGVMAAASTITVSLANATAAVGTAVQQAATQVASGTVGVATSAVNTALVELLPLLLVVVAIILFVLPSLAKSTGARVSLG
jgi:hypothetical protein